MAADVSVVLVGIGGYGNLYVEALLKEGEKRGTKIVGAVDPRPENCKYYEELKKRGIPFFASLEEFYAQSKVDLAVISSPIHYHSVQTCLALENGSHVLCEKPAAATIQELKKMIETRDRTGKFVSIGYQWSNSTAIHNFKKDIIEGVFGKPKQFKTIILWPRNDAYYQRASWSGRIRDDKGNWILDSVASNATAHYLHNMFYILGKQLNESARPAEVTAELYRANNIENYDTAAIRVYTQERVELLFFATHAVKETLDPVFNYQFENATVVFGDPDIPESSSNIVALFNDGTKKFYGDPFEQVIRKLWIAVDAVRGEASIPCGLEAASSHTICVNAAQESMNPIISYPSSIIRRDEEKRLTWVEGLAETLKECYAAGKTPSELGVTWAKPGKKIDVMGYDFFKGENIK